MSQTASQPSSKPTARDKMINTSPRPTPTCCHVSWNCAQNFALSTCSRPLAPLVMLLTDTPDDDAAARPHPLPPAPARPPTDPSQDAPPIDETDGVAAPPPPAATAAPEDATDTTEGGAGGVPARAAAAVRMGPGTTGRGSAGEGIRTDLLTGSSLGAVGEARGPGGGGWPDLLEGVGSKTC